MLKASHVVATATVALTIYISVDYVSSLNVSLPYRAAESRTVPSTPVYGRFWGRDVFEPDWIQGDEIDLLASTHFLTEYWPNFSGSDTAEANPKSEHYAHQDVHIFPTKYWKTVSTDYIPPSDLRHADPVKMVAAQGESEPIAIGVRSNNRPHTISIIHSDFTGPTGTLSAKHVTNRLMLAYRAEISSRHTPYGTEVRPMVLLKTPNNQWLFPADHSMTYVVDFHVPSALPAGIYQGNVSVLADGIVLKDIATTLQVLPFRLKTNNFHAGAFGTTFNIWEGGFSGYTTEMMEMDSRYGFNLAGGFFNKGNEIPFRRRGDYEVIIDTKDPKFRKFNTTMRTMRRYGMGDVAFWNWGASGKVFQFNNVLKSAGFSGIETIDGKKGFAAICAALKAAEREHGWPEFVINPFDEALKDQDAVREIIAAVPYVRVGSPSTRLYMTEWRPGYSRLYQSSGHFLRGNKRPRKLEQIALFLSRETARLNFDVIGSNTLDDSARILQDSLGGELWHYGGANNLNAQARLTFGVIPWAIRAEAALMWANYKGDLNGKGWTLHFAMPLDPHGRRNRNTRGPIVPSVRAVAVREGIDDRRYIETLRYFATIGGSQKDLDYLKNLEKRARNLISNPNTVGGINNSEIVTNRESEMDEIRTEIQNRITALLH